MLPYKGRVEKVQLAASPPKATLPRVTALSKKKKKKKKICRQIF
jgi:hypothetical protein